MANFSEEAGVTLKIDSKEAQQKLDSLKKQATDLRKEFSTAFKKGDTKEINRINQELQKTTREIKKMQTNAANVNDAMKRLGELAPKELRRTLGQINAELNSGRIPRGTKEWEEYAQKLSLVKEELRRVSAELHAGEKEEKGLFDGIAEWGQKWVGAYTIIDSVLSKLGLDFQEMRANFEAKEESQANLKALTGLDDDSIQWLTEQAEKLSTTMDETGLRITQSSREILDAYMMVGSNKPELLGNSEELNTVTVEAMRLASAAKMELGPAVDAMTTALNQYGEGADQAARFVNVLAAGSKSGASNVVQQAASILKAGTAAASANVTFEELVGTIEMLGEKGIKGEVAGTGLKKLFLVLQTGAKETNPKVVGLNTALENLNAMVERAEKKKVGGGASFLKDMFGEEAYSIASILSANTEAVRNYTEAVSDTQTAMEQAATNSDTTAAKMAQMRNRTEEAGNELMETLNPAVGYLAQAAGTLVGVLPVVVKAIVACRGAILGAAAAILLYNTATKASIILDKLKVFWTDKALVSIKKFFSTLVKHPYGALLAVIGAVVGGLIQMSRRHEDAAKAAAKHASEERKLAREAGNYEAEAKKSAAEEVRRAKALYDAATDETKSKKERIKAAKQLIDLYPDQLKGLSAEKIAAGEAATAYEALTASILENARAKAAANKLIKNEEQIFDAQAEIDALEEERKIIEKKRDDIVKFTRERNNRVIENGMINSPAGYSALKDSEKADTEPLDKQISEIGDKVDAQQRIIDINKKANENIAKTFKDNKVFNEQLAGGGTTTETKITLGETEKERKEREKKEREAAKKAKEALKKELDEAKSLRDTAEAQNIARYATGVIDFREYSAEKERIEKEHADKVVEIHEKHNKVDIAAYGAALKSRMALQKKHQDEQRKLSLQALDRRHDEHQDAIVADFYDTSSKFFQNERAMNQRLLQEDLRYLEEKKKLYVEGSQEAADIQKQIDDRLAQDRLAKQKELVELIEKYRASREPEMAKARRDVELAILEEGYKQKQISEEEYLEWKKRINEKYRLQEEAANKDKTDSAEIPGADGTGKTVDLRTSSEKKATAFANIVTERDQTLDALKGLYEKGEIDEQTYLDRRVSINKEANEEIANIAKEGLDQQTAMVFKLGEAWFALFHNLKENGRLSFEDLADAASSTVSALCAGVEMYTQFAQAQAQIDIANTEAKYDAMIQAAGNNKAKVEQLEKEKEEKVNKIKAEAQGKEFQAKIVEAIAQTAQNAINAYGAMAGIPVVGPALGAAAAAAATAMGMVQIALIKKQQQAAKQQGYYSGGFTDRDPDNRREVGVVHANEFVANHRAVANPALSPVLSLIDRAQRANTVGSLTAADVSNALGQGRGVSARGEVAAPAPGSDPLLAGSVAAMADTSAATRKALDRLSENLEGGIETYVVMDGERGLHKKLKHYEKLIQNPKR